MQREAPVSVLLSSHGAARRTPNQAALGHGQECQAEVSAGYAPGHHRPGRWMPACPGEGAQNSTQNTAGHATAACSVVDQLSLGRPPLLHATMRHLLTASPGGGILSGWDWLELR